MCLLSVSQLVHAAGDPSRGANVFQACASWHSVKSGEQLTGPSLAQIWNHKAGDVPGFTRYSEAMKKTNIMWNEENLHRWLTNPGAFIPGTSFLFHGSWRIAAILPPCRRPLVIEGRTMVDLNEEPRRVNGRSLSDP